MLSRKLEEIKTKLSEDKELSKMVPYRITERGQNETSRRNALLQYDGPDVDTVNLLDDNYEEWTRHPAFFWSNPTPKAVDPNNPQAYIVNQYLQTFRNEA